MIGIGRIELGERRQTLLGELRGVPSAHRGDEAAGRHTLRARFDHRLHLGDRCGAFERRVIARPDAEQHDVIVVVDEAWDDRTAAKVDLARAWARTLIPARADRGEAAVLDRHLAHRRIATIHRRDLAVGQMQIARVGARIDLRLPRLSGDDRHEQNGTRYEGQCRAGLQTRRRAASNHHGC
jgi:hypothetical protein